MPAAQLVLRRVYGAVVLAFRPLPAARARFCSDLRTGDDGDKSSVRRFELAEASLVAGADLYTDLGLDSLDTVDLVVALKVEFGFKVDRRRDEERIRAVRTLEDLHAFVNLKMSEGLESRSDMDSGQQMAN